MCVGSCMKNPTFQKANNIESNLVSDRKIVITYAILLFHPYQCLIMIVVFFFPPFLKGFPGFFRH